MARNVRIQSQLCCQYRAFRREDARGNRHEDGTVWKIEWTGENAIYNHDDDDDDDDDDGCDYALWQKIPTVKLAFLYSWFRASWLYINKIQRDATVCRCLFTWKLLYMFRVSIAPIIRSTSNCKCSFWYIHITCQSNNLPPAWPN